MYKLMLCRLYVRRLGLIVLLVMIANGLITFIFKPLTDGVTKEQIAHNLVYYEGPDVVRYEQYAKDNSLEYDLSPSVHGQKDFIVSLGEDAIEPIYIYDLNYLKDTSKELITTNLDILNKDNEKFIDMSNIYISIFPPDINDYQIINERLEIKEVLVGNYPSSPDEILIPENYAISIANEKNIDSYQQLLGEQVTIADSNYTIVGVFNGSNHIIAYPSPTMIEYYQQYADEAIFIHLTNSEQKTNFYNTFDKAQVTNASDYYLSNIKFVIPTIIEYTILLLSILYLTKEQNNFVKILNHHSYKLSNYIIPMLIPISLILLITQLV